MNIGHLYRAPATGNLFLLIDNLTILWLVSENRSNFEPDTMSIKGLEKNFHNGYYEDLGCLGEILNGAINES